MRFLLLLLGWFLFSLLHGQRGEWPRRDSLIDLDSASVNPLISVIISTPLLLDAYDPLNVLTGQIAGVEVAEIGDDPNQRPDVRIRSLSTLGGSGRPLLVLDGLVVDNLNIIDPRDIADIWVHRGGMGAGKYGIRGGNGVIEIHTYGQHFRPEGLRVYSSASIDAVRGLPPVADALEYRDLLSVVTNPGNASRNDFGQNQIWPEAITRNGLSHAHHLAYGKVFGDAFVQASLAARNRRGIGVANDGFTQLNGYLNLQQLLLEDRLRLSAGIQYNRRRAEIFDYDVFGYAYVFNPTAPTVVTPDNEAQLPVNLVDLAQDRYGGYFELDRFGLYNPIAIAEQTRNRARQNDGRLYLAGEWDVLPKWRLSAAYQGAERQRDRGFLAVRESRFAGGADGPANVRGAADLSTLFNRNEQWKAETVYRRTLGSTEFSITGGYDYQRRRTENQYAGGFGLPDNEFNPFDLPANLGMVNEPFRITGDTVVDKIAAFYGELSMDFGSIEWRSYLRREGSSRLSVNQRWNTFAGGELSYRFGLGNKQKPWLASLTYAESGHLPRGAADYLQRFVFGRDTFPIEGQNQLTTSPASAPSVALGSERKREWSLGLDWNPAGPWRWQLSYYLANTTDLIFTRAYSLAVYDDNFIPINFDNLRISSGGLESTLEYNYLGQGSRLNTRLSVTTYGSRLRQRGERTDENVLGGSIDRVPLTGSGPLFRGQLDKSPTQIVVGDQLGGLYVGKLDRRASEELGRVVFVDQNRDEIITAEDNQILRGNGIPDWTLGLSQRWENRNWSISWVWRGQFGHELINYPFSSFGTSGWMLGGGNVVLGPNYLDLIRGFPSLSDNDVESASFLALDNFQIGRKLAVGAALEVEIYLGGRDLIYITPYSGNDPRARLFDNSPLNEGNPLMAGLDRVESYWRSARFSAGIMARF